MAAIPPAAIGCASGNFGKERRHCVSLPDGQQVSERDHHLTEPAPPLPAEPHRRPPEYRSGNRRWQPHGEEAAIAPDLGGSAASEHMLRAFPPVDTPEPGY